MNTIRNRLEQLLTDSGAYQQGRQDERERLQHLIDIRIDQLQIIDRHHRQQIRQTIAGSQTGRLPR